MAHNLKFVFTQDVLRRLTQDVLQCCDVYSRRLPKTSRRLTKTSTWEVLRNRETRGILPKDVLQRPWTLQNVPRTSGGTRTLGYIYLFLIYPFKTLLTGHASTLFSGQTTFERESYLFTIYQLVFYPNRPICTHWSLTYGIYSVIVYFCSSIGYNIKRIGYYTHSSEVAWNPILRSVLLILED